MHLVNGSAVIGAASPHGGTWTVWQPVLHGMVLQDHQRVRSEESLHAVQRSTATVHRNSPCNQTEFLVSLARSCLLSFSSQSTEFDALSSATPIPGRLSVFSGLTIQTLLRGTIQWHSGGALFVSWGAF